MKSIASKMGEFTNGELLDIIREFIPDARFGGEIKRLSGGNINVVWRAKGETNVIIKHAPPHIATSPDVPLSNSRIDFEARALSLFDKGGRLFDIISDQIRPPKLYGYDKEQKLIIMEDVGSYRELGKSDMSAHSPDRLGQRLGQFIGELHKSTYRNDFLAGEFHNTEIQKVRNQLQYQPAADYADVDDKRMEAKIRSISQGLGNKLLGKGVCLVMGDLWPPSVLVNNQSHIRLIDWEFVHFGRPLQDVGHFAAHCLIQQHVLNHQTESSWWDDLWKAFLEAYKNRTGELFAELFTAEDLIDFGIHIGTEILIRAFGPFKEGYVYEPYDVDHIVLREAKKMAITYISDKGQAAELLNLNGL